MKDLKIRYKDETGEIKSKDYDTIMDFIDEIESNVVGTPMLTYEIVDYIVFENPRNTGKGGTIEELLRHCKEITS